MSNQNFRVKNGLEVGIGATISSDGNVTAGIVTATTLVKSGGTSSEFLKADGSVDPNTYLISTGSGSSLTGIVTSIVAGTNVTISGSTGQVTINAAGGSGGIGVEIDTLDSVTTRGSSTTNSITVGNVIASALIKSGGTSNQFLKADGSVDSRTFLTAESDTLNSVTSRGNTTSNSITVNNFSASSATVSSLNITGCDFMLGSGCNRGNSGSSRALVKDTNATLAINYSGDFTGGVRVDSALTVSGETTLNGTTLFGDNAYVYKDILFDNRDVTGQKLSWWAPDTDYAYIRYVSTGDNTSSKLELAVGNNAENPGGMAESVVVNRYNSSGNVASSLKLFDEYGHTVIPGNLTVLGSFIAVGGGGGGGGGGVESDTLNSVTTRGNTTANSITVGSLDATNTITIKNPSGVTGALGTPFTGPGAVGAIRWESPYTDWAFIRFNSVGDTSPRPSQLEIAIGDNGDAANGQKDSIVVRQYYQSGTEARTLSLLDPSGNTVIPGNLTVKGTINGSYGNTVGTFSVDNETNIVSSLTSLGFRTTGTCNFLVGKQAGCSLTSGYNNTFIGGYAGKNVTFAANNTFIGHKAGCSNTTGGGNLFIGRYSGCSNVSGIRNLFIGNLSGLSNTAGCYNIFIGRCSGYSNTKGIGNIFLGVQAGSCYTEPGFYVDDTDLTPEYSNIFIGNKAGHCNVTGVRNINIGAYSGFNNKSSWNVFIGNNSGRCNTNGFANLFVGDSTGTNNTGGYLNVFLGDYAGFRNTTASHNVFVGIAAGFENTTGKYNTFLGSSAGLYNTTGVCNTFVGHRSGPKNTIGDRNTFIGQQSGYCNTTGFTNTFIGHASGCLNTDASYNTFLGYASGRTNTASCNTFIGWASGSNNTTGSRNVFLGMQSGSSNTTGDSNVIIGYASGLFTTYGYENVFLGKYSGFYNVSGHRNVFLGCGSGSNNTSGYRNTFVGTSSGQNNTTGTHNTYIGWRAGETGTIGCNNIAIGSYAGTSPLGGGIACLAGISNRIIMGNSSNTCAQIQISWTTVSDVRDKCIFGPVPHGRGFLQGINPIEFAFKNRETGELVDEQNKRRYGFCAQEILDLEGENSVIVSSEDPEKLQLTSDYLIPILVNAVKEISNELDALKLDTSKIKDQIAQIEQIMSSQ